MFDSWFYSCMCSMLNKIMSPSILPQFPQVISWFKFFSLVFSRKAHGFPYFSTCSKLFVWGIFTWEYLGQIKMSLAHNFFPWAFCSSSSLSVAVEISMSSLIFPQLFLYHCRKDSFFIFKVQKSKFTNFVPNVEFSGSVLNFCEEREGGVWIKYTLTIYRVKVWGFMFLISRKPF